MYAYQPTENERRLFEMGGSFVAIKVGAVNIDDLLNAWRPGAIVRCSENPADVIRLFPADDTALGCVAGWISEAE